MAKENWMTPLQKQMWTISGVLLTVLGLGMAISYPSSLLPVLRDPDSPIKTDLYTASWITSAIGMASVPGLCVGSFLMAYMGRKKTHALVTIPAILGWLLIYFASDVTVLIVGRICTGLANGFSISFSAVVIGEFSNPEFRGIFLTMKTTIYSGGIMLTHILGHYLSWRTIALIGIIPHSLSLGITLTWPESPAWLASKKQFDKCRKDFLWLRGSNEKSTTELEDLIAAQMKIQSVPNSSLFAKMFEFMKKFTRRDFLKPVFIVVLSMIVLELSGRHYFPANALDIIGKITGNESQSFYYTLGIDAVVLVGTIVSAVLLKMMRRRTLLFSTGFAAVAVMAGVCAYLLLESKQIISSDHPWIPVSLLVLYFMSVNLGCTPIPFTYLGEMLPLAHRGLGSFFGGITLALFIYITLQITPILLVTLGVHGMFTVFCVGLGGILLILYFIVPETKDRTLQEIDNYFTYGDYKIKDDEDAVVMLEKKIGDVYTRVNKHNK